MKRSLIRWLVLTAGFLTALLLLFPLILTVLVRAGRFGPLPGESELLQIKNPLASEVYSSDGVLMGTYFLQNRHSVDPGDIPLPLKQALIATEDARFYRHRGIDFRSLGRVVIKSILLGDSGSGGGSTLSQQLAKNLYPRHDHGALTVPVNKIREMIIARRLESALGKETILETYLNTVPFGENTFGIMAASRRYFNKETGELKLEEMAVLVGMLKATSTYHPVRDPERSLARRNVVLSRMALHGVVEEAVLDSLQGLPLVVDYHPLPHNAGIAPYFREYLRPILASWCASHTKENGDAYNLYTDGLRIHTTLDSRMQEHAETAMKEHMRPLQERFDQERNRRDPLANLPPEQLFAAGGLPESVRREAPARNMEVFTWQGPKTMHLSRLDSLRHHLSFLQAGILVLDVDRGGILAWVGGIDYGHFKYDHVLSLRQPGSAFKPLVYLEALEQGISPCRYLANDSVVYTDFDNWTPRNADRQYGGYFSMKGALAHSVNTVSTALLMEVGIDSVLNLAARAGIRSTLPSVPSLALGTGELSLLELCTFYLAVANGGVARDPACLVRIEDSQGRVLEEWPLANPGRRVCKEDNARLLTGMLQGVVQRGTARGLSALLPQRVEVAGKTGTTQGGSDGWFIGYTPDLLAGVWVGGDFGPPSGSHRPERPRVLPWPFRPGQGWLAKSQGIPVGKLVSGIPSPSRRNSARPWTARISMNPIQKNSGPSNGSGECIRSNGFSDGEESDPPAFKQDGFGKLSGTQSKGPPGSPGTRHPMQADRRPGYRSWTPDLFMKIIRESGLPVLVFPSN
ncbi:MAG: transglycosylase domain-containing protein [Bacteroidales bacterium]